MYFPASTTLARSLKISGIALEEDNPEAGRYTWTCAPDLSSFDLAGRPSLHFERQRRRTSTH